MEILSRICLQLGVATFLRVGEIHSIVIENKGPLYILMVLTSQLAAAPPSGHHSLAHGIFLRVLCSLLTAPASHLIALSSVSSIPPRLTEFLLAPTSRSTHIPSQEGFVRGPLLFYPRVLHIPNLPHSLFLSLWVPFFKALARSKSSPGANQTPRMWQELWPLTTQAFCARVWLKALSSLCSPSLQSSVPFHNRAWGYHWEHLVH